MGAQMPQIPGVCLDSPRRETLFHRNSGQERIAELLEASRTGRPCASHEPGFQASVARLRAVLSVIVPTVQDS